MPISQLGDVWTIGRHTLINDDATQTFVNTKPNAIITSPPYLAQRDYSQSIPDWDQLMQSVFDNLPTNDSTQIFVNLGHIHKDHEVVEYWHDWIKHMRANGYRHFQTIIWDKIGAIPGDFHGRLAPGFEYIFHLNTNSIRPNKSIAKQATSIRVNTRNVSIRKANGTMARVSSPTKSLQTHKIATNIIRCHPDKWKRFDHPAVFPVNLPKQIMEAYTQENDIVLDPFAGSGSTIIAAHELNRIGIGIELSETYTDIAITRLQKELNTWAYRQDGQPFENLKHGTDIFEREYA